MLTDFGWPSGRSGPEMTASGQNGGKPGLHGRGVKPKAGLAR